MDALKNLVIFDPYFPLLRGKMAGFFDLLFRPLMIEVRPEGGFQTLRAGDPWYTLPNALEVFAWYLIELGDQGMDLAVEELQKALTNPDHRFPWEAESPTE